MTLGSLCLRFSVAENEKCQSGRCKKTFCKKHLWCNSASDLESKRPPSGLADGDVADSTVITSNLREHETTGLHELLIDRPKGYANDLYSLDFYIFLNYFIYGLHDSTNFSINILF